MTGPPAIDSNDSGAPIAALWAYLSSWLSRDGAVTGPVVHRADLKRMFSIHDTAWTQQAVIGGLLHLYRRSEESYWLDNAVRLADLQCARLAPNGSFRWAGHEDDRFSSLINNVLADCALLDAAAVLKAAGDPARGDRYAKAVETNLERYVIEALWRPELTGFAMGTVDHYAGRDRFIVNMNSVAVEALIKLDRYRGTAHHAERVLAVGERILELQADTGLCEGSFPYAHVEPDVHVPLYTAIAIRGLRALADVREGDGWAQASRRAGAFLDRVVDAESGLWPQLVTSEGAQRFPFFVAGAGMICSGRLDAAEAAGEGVDVGALVSPILSHRHSNGAIRNFIGYDHPDNGLRAGTGRTCWEDLFPTPNWNAQAFEFLCRVLPPPDPPKPTQKPRLERTVAVVPHALYVETTRFAAVMGWWPLGNTILAFYVKGWRYGIVLPGLLTIARRTARLLRHFALGRALISRFRTIADRSNARRRAQT